MESNEQPPLEQWKRCHGNRKDQRFRKRCRARGMKEKKIEKLLMKRKKIHHQRHPNTDNVTEQITAATTNPSTSITDRPKRKRDDRSNPTISKAISSISIAPSSPKKMKKKYQHPTTTTTMTMASSNNNRNDVSEEKKNYYRIPMYLKRSPTILFQILKPKLNLPLKRADERHFIHHRLALFDRHYCFEVDLKLQQSYLDIGSEQQRWPDSICFQAKTDDFHLCERYLRQSIDDLKKQLNDCQMELVTQAESYATTQLTLDQIDRVLKDYVDHQRKYLADRNQKQLVTFNETIHRQKRVQSLSIHDLSVEQMNSIDHLLHVRQQQATVWKDLSMLEMRILCKFLPEDCDRLEYSVASLSYTQMNKDQRAIDFRNQRYKIIQQAKRAWLNVTLHAYEVKLQEHEQHYQNEFNQLKSTLSGTSVDQHGSALNSIEIYLNEQVNQFKQRSHDQMLLARHRLIQNRQRTSSNCTILPSPVPYLDLVENPFSQREWNYLCLGSSYIRLNQSTVRPKQQQDIIVKNEHRQIFNQVQKHLSDKPHFVPKTNSIFKRYSSHLLDYLNESFSAHVPYKDQILAFEQKARAQSIRKKIQQKQLILRVVDKGNTFYIGSSKPFDIKVQKYFTETNAFIQLNENPLQEILNRVVRTLKTMRSKSLISQKQLEKMLPDMKTSELAHLYFNPKIHKEGIPVRPIQHSIHAPTANISKFLDQLIRPIFDEKCKATSIINGSHLIQILEQYISKGLLKPSTLFCTFDIRNLYTMLPQEASLDILEEFLHFHGFDRVDRINLKTIRELASMVLKENVFVYGKNIYQQVLGGAMGSSFTLTLANIFMWKWQRELVRQQDITNEIFGRYIDDIVLTWNRSEGELRQLLDEANNTWHANIKLDYQIGHSLPFLDVLLINENGSLSTSIYRKASAEPYVVPFLSDHPRHVFANVVQGALTRAVRYSSSYAAFDYEQRYVKLMLLYNGYPSSFIEDHYRNFFFSFTSLSPFLPIIKDEKEFIHMRSQLLLKPTTRQSQLAINAASIHLDHDPVSHQSTIPKDIPVKSTSKINQDEKKMITHYTHERRFESMKRDMHKIYDDIFKETPVADVKMVVGSRNRRDARNDLIRKRPHHSILKNKPRLKRKNKFYKQKNLPLS